MINAKKLELINELKALKEEKGMSYQQIADKTAENGEPVSLSTVSWYSPKTTSTITITKTYSVLLLMCLVLHLMMTLWK